VTLLVNYSALYDSVVDKDINIRMFPIRNIMPILYSQINLKTALK